MTLKNTNLKNWWFKIFKLIEFIFKYCLKMYLKLHIILIYFFIETKIGYSFYLFFVLYGFFGFDETNYHESHDFASLFVLYIIKTTIELWLLFTIPFTKKYLDQLLTEKYIVRYLGGYNLT